MARLIQTVISQTLILVLFTFGRILSLSMSLPTPIKTIYGVPNSGWTSPQWNWGYAVGTGHDCAAICRRKYASRGERLQLINDLIEADTTKTDMEEVKLVMALEWQRNWRCGYGDVLEMMADARRYEEEGDPSPSSLLLMDMMERFHLLDPATEDQAAMDALKDSDNVDAALRTCSGLVLKAMGFGN